MVREDGKYKNDLEVENISTMDWGVEEEPQDFRNWQKSEFLGMLLSENFVS